MSDEIASTEITDISDLENKVKNLGDQLVVYSKQLNLMKDIKRQEDYAYLFSLDWVDCIEEIQYQRYIRGYFSIYYYLNFNFDHNSKFYNQIQSYINNYQFLHLYGNLNLGRNINTGFEFTIYTSNFDTFKNFINRLDCHIGIEPNTLKEMAQDTYILNKNMNAITFQYEDKKC